MLTRKFEVTELMVDAPEIRAKTDLDGKLNLSNIFLQENPPSEDAPQFSFAVENVRLNDGKIDYTNTQRDLKVSVQGVTININGPLNTWNHDGNLRIDAGSFTFNGSEMPIDNFEVDFQILATHNELSRLQLEFGNSHLGVTGHFPRGKTEAPWEISLNLQKLDLADVDQFFGEDTELQGDIKGRMAAFGTDSDFTVALTAEMPTFSITQAENNRHISLTDLIIDATLNLYPIP